MAKPLEMLLEREFRLCYYIPGFSLEDIRNTDSRELEWFYGRLTKQFQDEEKSYEKAQKSSFSRKFS